MISVLSINEAKNIYTNFQYHKRKYLSLLHLSSTKQSYNNQCKLKKINLENCNVTTT